MDGISPAVATAVLAITAAHPISMASHACEGLPIPASTMTGTSSSSTIILMKSLVRSPRLVPIGAPRGITAAAPASAMSRAAVRSGIMYGMGMKPSSASIPTALTVSLLSGRRYLVSRMISILMKSPQPSSLASLAMRTASSALLAPDVLGRRVMPSGMLSSTSPSPPAHARLTARVAISTPPSSMTLRVMSSENLPDPRMNLERNLRPPRIKSSDMSRPPGGRHPPPTNETISMRHPSATSVVGTRARGHIAPSISTATLEGSNPRPSTTSSAVEPVGNVLRSPFTDTVRMPAP